MPRASEVRLVCVAKVQLGTAPRCACATPKLLPCLRRRSVEKFEAVASHTFRHGRPILLLADDLFAQVRADNAIITTDAYSSRSGKLVQIGELQ